MSRTILAAAFGDGLKRYAEFQNSWGSAAFIWDMLCDKYQIPGEIMGERSRWVELWKYDERGDRLEPWERNALRVTYDNTVVQRENMPLVAESFRRFVKAYDKGTRVCSLGQQADAIDRAYAEGATWLAWTQTTVSDNWWLVRDEDDPDERKGYNPSTGTIHQVADLVPLESP